MAAVPPPPFPDRLAALSPRQRECLRLVGEGYEAKEIGRCLGISDPTVKNHLSAARGALGVARSSRRGAADRRVGGLPSPGAPGTSAAGGIADRSCLDDGPSRRSEPAAGPGGVRDGGDRPLDWTRIAVPLPFPTRRGQRNELGLGARLALVVVLTVLLIAAVGFSVQASRGLDF